VYTPELLEYPEGVCDEAENEDNAWNRDRPRDPHRFQERQDVIVW